MSLAAGTVPGPAPDIYHGAWIDLNKNGVKDPYEDPAVPAEDRITDLLARMTIEEKTAQMVTLYGFPRVVKDLVIIGNGMAPGRMLEHLLETAHLSFDARQALLQFFLRRRTFHFHGSFLFCQLTADLLARSRETSATSAAASGSCAFAGRAAGSSPDSGDHAL